MRLIRSLPLRLLLLLAVVLFAGHARAGASSSTTIFSPDCVTTSPTSGCMYVQGNGLGVTVLNPSGQTLGFSSTDIAGGGAVLIAQNNHFGSAGGLPSNIPVSGLQLGPGVFTSLSAGTQLLAPDMTFGQSGGGGVSFQRLSASSNLVWTGGIATPQNNQATGGSSTFGTVLWIINISGGGQQITIQDNTISGNGLHLPYSSIVVGYLETAGFIYDNSGWSLIGRGPSYYFNAGNNGGGAFVATTDATVTPIYLSVKGGGTTAGMGISCDVAAQLTGGTGTTMAIWQDVKCAWDGANNAILTSQPVIGATSGTNTHAPPTGWSLSCTTGASYNQLNVIGVAATNINWRANNCRTIAPPF